MSYKTPEIGTHTQDTISLWEIIPKSDELKTPYTRTHSQDTKIWLCCNNNFYHYITMSKHSQIRWVIKHLRPEHKDTKIWLCCDKTYITKLLDITKSEK